MTNLTPETLAELQRLQVEYSTAVGFQAVTDAWFGLARAAVSALPAFLAAESALARVRELHAPVEVEPSDTICAACSHQIGSGSRIRWMPTVEWPCPTIRALDATPGGES